MIKMNYYFYWFYSMLFFFFFFFFFFLLFLFNNYSLFLEWKIFSINSFGIYYILYFDWMSLLFISLVLFISSMVILYSSDYMGLYTYSSNRFLFLVILFIFSMALMIISPNLLSILLGWDGLGMISYCLVIYYNSMSSYLSGMITCLTNRLGDIGLLISICWLMSYGSWHFMFYLDYYSESIFYMLIISSFTKSAQIPFSSWLPAAMAAPTPVSSLVHSSTLVTAGVYLLIRFFNQLNFNNMYMLFISLLTMFMSSFCANYEFDLKKIIALSTLSQLGLMMSSLFLGMVDLSFFHLLTHAIFKSLLFLCAGIMIYYMNNNQDIRMMGLISNFLPFTTSCFNISSLALSGFPFLSGFYSKDIIVELMSMNFINFFIFSMFYICLGLTCCYSIRLFYYSLIYKNKHFSLCLVFENFFYMSYSIFVLSFFSIFFGCMMLWLISLDLNYIMIPFWLKLSSLIFVIIGGVLGIELFLMNSYVFNFYYYLFTNMWFMYSYSYYLYSGFYNFSNNYSLCINWGEYYGGSGISYYLLKISNLFQNYMLGNMKMFLVSFMVWFIIFI
uniref:NADH-ubiquinone oxidoreductase chain 5 n=2 Tax=Hiratettix TaxID=2509927 RepID=A0A9E6XT85_9HEMI|nr:NADH dehydrogenase subunit 5 [Hiratettix distanti]YP_010583098.1 NADH dehydrogenase subunit 5 [Hiratettix malaisei]UGN61530.1 NADH dehydrogenase subunit 5 [Hiratettix distanti]UGN61544.1 NADH dehydrogenase subunit 5 [Hiratettix malaisei]